MRWFGIIEKLDISHFKNTNPIGYSEGWLRKDDEKIDILQDDVFRLKTDCSSWSAEIEEIHEEPTKNGWIDVYERECVLATADKVLCGEEGKTVVEFGASIGYMMEEMKADFPDHYYIATDVMVDGLRQSYLRNQDVMHIQCDFTNAPFMDGSVDFVYSLNVLEHIEDDIGAMSECFRILAEDGYCLFVVPRGEKLYDYFDEMLFHKRRYAKGELRYKCEQVGFQIVDNFHYAWLCYPAFWLKKKWNRFVGKHLTRDEKLERVKKDINNAMESPLAIALMHLEHKLMKTLKVHYGVREFILCKKNNL